jgi:hypothetical protein
MSADKNVSVCVATSPRLLVEVDANRTGQKPPAPQLPSPNIIRPPPEADQAPKATGQRTNGRGFATAVVRELVRRARIAGLHMIFAHTLPGESASTSVLARCGFAPVAELIDPHGRPVWCWDLRLDENGGQRA